MNAIIVRERALTDDSRITNSEVNVQHLQSDMTEIKRTVGWLREAFESFKTEVAKEFGAIRTEMAEEFGAIRTEMTKELGAIRAEITKEFGAIRAEMTKELGAIRTEMAEELGSVRAQMTQESGSLRTSIERAKLWMVVTGLGTILSVWGAAFALARFLKP